MKAAKNVGQAFLPAKNVTRTFLPASLVFGKTPRLRFSRPGGTGREIGVGIGLSPYPSHRTGQADFPHPALQLTVVLST
ncbi:MAG: hypothetical protein WC708_20290, partial [Lentisphaeria bacterium]